MAESRVNAGLPSIRRFLIIGTVVIVVLALYPYSPSPATDIKNLSFELLAFLVLPLWLFDPQQAMRSSRPVKVLTGIVFAFLAVNLLASVVSWNPGFSLAREMIKLASLAILFVVSANSFVTPKHVWILFGVTCVTVAIASVYGFVQYLGLDPFPWGDTRGMLRQAPGTFGNPNLASHVLVLAVVMGSALCTQRKGRWAILALPIFAGHFYLTQTRGSLLGLAGAAVLVVTAMIVSRQERTIARAVGVTLLVPVIITVIGITATIASTFISRGDPFPFGSGESITLRYHSFFGAAEMIQDRPWLGYGPGMYEVKNPEYWTDLEKKRVSKVNMMNFQVHNELLQFAVEGGIPAAILYMALCVVGMSYGLSLWFNKHAPDRRSLGLALSAAILAFLLDGILGFNAHVPASSVLIFILFGTLTGLLHDDECIERREKRHGEMGLTVRLAVLVVATTIPYWGIRDFSAKFFQLRGLGAMNYKQYAAAAENFGKATSLFPYDWLNSSYWGAATMTAGDYRGAIIHFSRAVELNSNDFRTRLRLAECLFNIAATSPDDAESLLDVAVHHANYVTRMNPHFAEAHDLMGRAAILKAQWQSPSDHAPTDEVQKPALVETLQSAEEHFSAALEYGAEKPEKIYQLIALARSTKNDAAGSLNALVHAVHAKPDELETWRQFWNMSQKFGQYQLLLAMLDQYLQDGESFSMASENDSATLHIIHAKALYRVGDLAGAEEAFGGAVQKFPARRDAWAAFYAFATAAGRENSLKESLASTSHQNGKSTPQFLEAVSTGIENGEEDIIKGLSLLVDVIRTAEPIGDEPSDPKSLLWAVDLLASAVQNTALSPANSGSAQFMLGLSYGALGDYAKSVNMFELAAKALTGDQLTECLLQHGAVLTASGKTADAAGVLRRAANIAPTRFDVRYAYANALNDDGRYASATIEYQSILSDFALDSETLRRIQNQMEDADLRRKG